MNFKEATDALFERISHEDLADALGISVASIRQARLSPDANAFREPPKGWEEAVLQLAKKRLARDQRIVVQMERVVSAAAK
jgi:hypothetical protein